jgi:hypothetical protein
MSNLAILYPTCEDADAQTNGREIRTTMDAFSALLDDLANAAREGRLRCPNEPCHRPVHPRRNPNLGHTFAHRGKGLGTCAERKAVNDLYERPAADGFDLPPTIRTQVKYEDLFGWDRDVREEAMAWTELDIVKRTNQDVLNGVSVVAPAAHYSKANELLDGTDDERKGYGASSYGQASPEAVAAALDEQRARLDVLWGTVDLPTDKPWQKPRTLNDDGPDELAA